MQAGSLQYHRQSPLQHAGGGQREHACIHEVAKKLPACGCLKAFQTLLLCHSVQCATGGHTPCHTLSQCTIQLIRDEAIQHRRRLLSAALGPKSPRRKFNHKPYSSSLEPQCPGGSVLEEFVDSSTVSPRLTALQGLSSNNRSSMFSMKRKEEVFVGTFKPDLK